MHEGVEAVVFSVCGLFVFFKLLFYFVCHIIILFLLPAGNIVWFGFF